MVTVKLRSLKTNAVETIDTKAFIRALSLQQRINRIDNIIFVNDSPYDFSSLDIQSGNAPLVTGHVYTIGEQTIAHNADVQFSHLNPLSVGVTKPTPGGLQVSTFGVYSVEYGTTVLGVANNFALALVASTLPETVTSVYNGGNQNTGSALIFIPALTTLSLRNISGASTTLLDNENLNINAYIKVTLVRELPPS